MATILEQPAQAARGSIGIAGLPIDPVDEALPSAFAPFVRNAWYVVAESRAIGRQLSHIKVLGEPLVMYRTESGEAVVLDDRCAHRRFPLSKSKLVGDTIQCGYHGFTYEKSGACIWAPTLTVKPKFGVRRYPSAEVGPWLWAWFGDPAKADPATIPYPQLDPNERWQQIEGYKMNPGNYMLLIENFLDLTHLHFLHGPELSSLEETGNAPHADDLGPTSVGWHRISRDVAAGAIAAMAGGDPRELTTAELTDRQIGPSLNWGGDTRQIRLASGESCRASLVMIHAISPHTMSETHQFFQISVNFDVAGGLASFRDMLCNFVFEQDVEAIGAIHKSVEQDHRSGTTEYGIPGDRFGVKMRQILRRLKAGETD